MPTQLERMCTAALLQTLERKKATPAAELERQAAARQPLGFGRALRLRAAGGPAIIAELKKASPSKGLIRESFDPGALALMLESAGAAALSVLTDEEFFQGSLENLQIASAAVSIPCLRKDFIVHPYQLLEARAAGASAVLLIVAALAQDELRSLKEQAARLELDVLCEVHDADEAKCALDLGFTILGVNSRDLKTLKVHPELLHTMVAELPKSVLRVAESGIGGQDEMLALRSAGYDAFLIGEALMRQPDPGLALSKLLQLPYSAAR
jgi:indole-3-glycerol phosphate synthase